MAASSGRNERAARAFLRSARLRLEDDPRAAALLSGAIALDGKWDAASSRELRQLRAELAEYLPQRQPVPEPAPEKKPAPAGVTDIVERLGRRSSGA